MPELLLGLALKKVFPFLSVIIEQKGNFWYLCLKLRSKSLICEGILIPSALRKLSFGDIFYTFKTSPVSFKM